MELIGVDKETPKLGWTYQRLLSATAHSAMHGLARMPTRVGPNPDRPGELVAAVNADPRTLAMELLAGPLTAFSFTGDVEWFRGVDVYRPRCSKPDADHLGAHQRDGGCRTASLTNRPAAIIASRGSPWGALDVRRIRADNGSVRSRKLRSLGIPHGRVASSGERNVPQFHLQCQSLGVNTTNRGSVYVWVKCSSSEDPGEARAAAQFEIYEFPADDEYDGVAAAMSRAVSKTLKVAEHAGAVVTSDMLVYCRSGKPSVVAAAEAIADQLGCGFSPTGLRSLSRVESDGFEGSEQCGGDCGQDDE
jgi:hypothetical protein